MAEQLDEEMVATYGVTITGIERTKAEMKRLTGAIEALRKAEYSEGVTLTTARFSPRRSDRILGAKGDVFVAAVELLEGRVQDVAGKSMARGMALGRKAQAAALRAAETDTGKSGKPKGRKGPGREVTSALINGIVTNVETQKNGPITQILGWHGWKRERPDYFKYQELGTKGRASGQQPEALKRKVAKRRSDAAKGRGVPAANSLGASIILVREQLKRDLGALKK